LTLREVKVIRIRWILIRKKGQHFDSFNIQCSKTYLASTCSSNPGLAADLAYE
jgi:hypothetical protein